MMRQPAGMRTGTSVRRGFTLIELLLVLVILTALAAIVVPKFTRRSEHARITAARADIANLEVALDAFEVDTGRYPTTEEGLAALECAAKILASVRKHKWNEQIDYGS